MTTTTEGTGTETKPTTETTATTETKPTTESNPLGPAGEAALAAERTARVEAEKREKALQKRLEDLEAANKTAEEKALDDAKKSGRDEATGKFKLAFAKAAVRAAAAGKFANPADAPLFVDLTKVEVDEEGNADEKAVLALVEAALKERPYLGGGTGSKPVPLPGGGAQEGGDAQHPNALIRTLAGRGG